MDARVTARVGQGDAWVLPVALAPRLNSSRASEIDGRPGHCPRRPSGLSQVASLACPYEPGDRPLRTRQRVCLSACLDFRIVFVLFHSERRLVPDIGSRASVPPRATHREKSVAIVLRVLTTAAWFASAVVISVFVPLPAIPWRLLRVLVAFFGFVLACAGLLGYWSPDLTIEGSDTRNEWGCIHLYSGHFGLLALLWSLLR
jgi:hypothetical protein